MPKYRGEIQIRIIKNNHDVLLLYEAGVIGDEFREHLTRYFDRLQADLDELDPNRYSVEDCGYVVILEEGDNVRDLSNVGLNPSNSGLLGSGPEYCEVLQLDGIGYYSLLIIYNNSFAIDFYSPMGCYDEEVEQWLAEQICFD